MKDKPVKILLVEDNPADARLIREMLADADAKDAFVVTHIARLKDALEQYAKEGFDAVLLDLILPDSMGIETFLKVYKQMSAAPVVVLTGLSDEAMAIKAVREGAQDYLVKGHVDSNLLVRSIRYAIERKTAEKTAKKPPSELSNQGDEYQYFKIIGANSGLKDVARLIATVAKTSSTSVLIEGETGTGKGLAANAIHYLSSRKDKPLIKINCSSIPDTLLETELFGYEKGAFTDARQSKKGLFEVAEGGAIFLDEIGDMDIRLQPKLLHVLENRTFHRVGGIFDVKVDVRVIAASNKDLSLMVKEKRFREDLYYRLKVMTLTIPPLRERKEDILPLAEYFIQESNRIHRKDIKGLSARAREIFLKYSWPGNVREMKNEIERAVLIANSEEILPDHLHLELTKDGISKNPSPVYPPSEDMSLKEMEKAHILNILNKVNGNKTQASKILGISRLTLREKIKKYSLAE
ncbi:MAG: sigma-54-dependent Fis family transcriptional regulator [Deltaproteobacteria bacterium]|nr:sigma-54-dependent Fis family transcriptional regulator [Deltaproteobacteria bacterium]